jgi:MYXO-CTERM domain-containing protein
LAISSVRTVRFAAKIALSAVFMACIALVPATAVRAEDLIVDGTGAQGRPTTFTFQTGTELRRYDHVCVINGGVVSVAPYAGVNKAIYGNLELIAGSILVDATSRITARGAGYQTARCSHGTGPDGLAGGRGGCAVMDSGGGGAHMGRGGRGTIDAPLSFPTHYEDNCGWTWNGSACSNTADCGTDAVPCPAYGTPSPPARVCKVGPSVAGEAYWHNIYDPEFGASGGDKGCRDGLSATNLVTGGAGGGRIVLVGLSEHAAPMTTSPCGLPNGTVRIEGTVDAGGKRGCGQGNDSGGGGAGGTVLIVGSLVEVTGSANVSAAGGLGGDTNASANVPENPDYLDCVGTQAPGGTCDDCGGGGGGGIISVLSVSSDLDPAATFNVSGALGGTCTVCKGEAGGGAGELQLDGAYVGEYCDGYDNDFDGDVDEGLGTQVCGLGSCAETIDACNLAQGEPLSCEPETDTDPSCKSPADGARPRIAVILDTSASMLLSLDGYPTFGDGSEEHPGIDVDGDLAANDSRLLLAREALAQVISAYPEIDFSLSRYHQDQGEDRSCQSATWFECQGLVGTYNNPADNTGAHACDVPIGPDPDGPAEAPTVEVLRDPQNGNECINYAGSCGPPRRGADVLTGFGMPTRDIVRWLDGRETGFDPSQAPGNVCDHAGGGDCEVRGSGPTPLAGSLEAILDYVSPVRATDGAAACRDYSVILVTDGAESCNGDPAAAAAALYGVDPDHHIQVYVIAVSVLPEEVDSLNLIASAGSGGTRTEATLVSSPSELVPALTEIIAGSIRFESCNDADDDCDGRIDEDFPGLGSSCDDGNKGICRGTGSVVCNDDGSGTECDITMPGSVDGDEICNVTDDDCDGAVDEGLDCTNDDCTPSGDEICNLADEDCDGHIDESDPAIGSMCGTGQGQCERGTLLCVSGVLECVGGTGPVAEQCNGLDDDCNGETDDDAPCPAGSACIGGACRPACDPTAEFPCPVRSLCTEYPEHDGFYCVPSACASCTADERCQDGACVNLCTNVSCGEGEMCVRGDCRDCHSFGCPAGQVCFASVCTDDPCAGVSCEQDAFCYEGACIPRCDDAMCAAGETCNAEGACQADPCAALDCPAGESCVDGACRANICSTMSCASGDVCVSALGCVDDPCPVTRCPTGSVCKVAGDGKPRCLVATVGGAPADSGVTEPAEPPAEEHVSATGSSLFGCSVQKTGSGTGSAGGWVALLAVFALLRSRRRSR